MLISGLPVGGLTYRAVNGNGWAEREYLLADLIDATNQVSHSVYQAQAGRKRVRKPRRYPRPGDVGEARIGDRGDRSPDEVVAYLDTLKPTTPGKG